MVDGALDPRAVRPQSGIGNGWFPRFCPRLHTRSDVFKLSAASPRALHGTEQAGENTERQGSSVRASQEHISPIIHRLPLGTGDLTRIRAP